jgi:hypothetical protein
MGFDTCIFSPAYFAETQKKYRWDLTFSPRSLPEQSKSSSKTIALTTPLLINPSLWMSMGNGGAAGAAAMATLAGKKQQKKTPGGPKISNNFEPIGRQNLPHVAKAGNCVSKPEVIGSTPR